MSDALGPLVTPRSPRLAIATAMTVGALVFAMAAMVSVVAWDVDQDVSITVLGYVARAGAYFPIAVAAGIPAGRLRTANSVP
jgi:hypothetical protein